MSHNNNNKKNISSTNSRKTLQDRLKEALAKKPTASFINNNKENNLNNLKEKLSNQRVIKNNKRKRFSRPNKIDTKNTKSFYDPPTSYGESYEYKTPDWFRNDDLVDVSVIIPLYKSKEVIKDLINSWFYDEELKVEIIFIDDCCPDNSKETVIATFNNKKNKLNCKIGKIICNEKNKGYGQSCNAGVKYAKGKYLIFLNADTKVTENWIKPMIELFEDESVGLIGNLQLKDGGPFHGTIDSAGSEWRWNERTFAHIGRHSYQKQNINRPFNLDSCPDELLTVQEREMVTGCCFSMKKELFDYIGGFNPNYKIGYWEDSEICLNVRELGYKVLYQPNSLIWHKLGHTSSGGHKYFWHNKEYFTNKWINSYRLDRLLLTESRLIKSESYPTEIMVKRTNAHGDVLVAAGICSALKVRYPKSRINFITQYPEALTNHKYIDKIYKPEDIKNIKFDLFYNLDLCYEWRPNINILTAYAEAVGEKAKNCNVYVDKSPINITLPENFVVIHAGRTDWVGRDWPSYNFEQIATYLKNKNIPVVTVGKHSEPEISCDLDLRGKTNIQQLAYVIDKCKLFIGIDSFPMHIAQAVNANGICFFGSILPESRIYSKNMQSINAEHLACLGCHHRKTIPSTVTRNCENNTLACIKDVSVEMMIKKIDSLLDI